MRDVLLVPLATGQQQQQQQQLRTNRDLDFTVAIDAKLLHLVNKQFNCCRETARRSILLSRRSR